jgi:hypothetical protein
MVFIYISCLILIVYVVQRIIKSFRQASVPKTHSPNPKIKIDSILSNLNKRMSEKFIEKEYRDCIAIADKILAINPQYYKALTTRASSLLNLGFNLDAIEDYLAALAIQDKDGNMHGLLGMTYRKVGEIEKSNNHLKRAVELGFKMYEMQLQIFLSLTEEGVKMMIDKGKNHENQIRRNKAEFEDSLSEVDRGEYQKGLESAQNALKASLELDPNNKELQKLSERIKAASLGE